MQFDRRAARHLPGLRLVSLHERSGGEGGGGGSAWKGAESATAFMAPRARQHSARGEKITYLPSRLKIAVRKISPGERSFFHLTLTVYSTKSEVSLCRWPSRAPAPREGEKSRNCGRGHHAFLQVAHLAMLG